MVPECDRLPFEPLEQAMKRLLGDDYSVKAVMRWCEMNRATARNWYQMKRQGWLRYDKADRWAVLIGMHPALIWPDWFDRSLARVQHDEIQYQRRLARNRARQANSRAAVAA